MGQNAVEWGQATDKIIRRMRIACWIHKPTNTNSEYVILITFLQQQLLHERALTCFVNYNVHVSYIKLKQNTKL